MDLMSKEFREKISLKAAKVRMANCSDKILYKEKVKMVGCRVPRSKMITITYSERWCLVTLLTGFKSKDPKWQRYRSNKERPYKGLRPQEHKDCDGIRIQWFFVTWIFRLGNSDNELFWTPWRLSLRRQTSKPEADGKTIFNRDPILIAQWRYGSKSDRPRAKYLDKTSIFRLCRKLRKEARSNGERIKESSFCLSSYKAKNYI